MLISFLNNFDIKIIATSFDIRVKSTGKRMFFLVQLQTISFRHND